jgi:hypothetical protein
MPKKRTGRKRQVSRQLRRQRRLRELGRCIICNRPAARKKASTARRPVYASRCPSCLEVQRLRYYRMKNSARRSQGRRRKTRTTARRAAR